MGRVCRDFAIAYVLGMIGMILLGALVQFALGRDLGNFSGVVPVLAAAMFAGHRYGSLHGQPAESGFAWRAAFWMLLICIVYSVVAVSLFILILGSEIAVEVLALLGDLRAGFWIIVIAILLVLYLLVPRFFFGLGARMAAKAAQKRLQDTF